jgi:hypothetical protein
MNPKAAEEECRMAIEALHRGIWNKDPAVDALLWYVVLKNQNKTYYTSSGLEFSYTVKCRRDGSYSGELLISRKEESKTLTKSSILLAFHKVLEQMDFRVLDVPDFKGPKAIGQIFGISYIYSLFWNWGLIRVPEKIEAHMKQK